MIVRSEEIDQALQDPEILVLLKKAHEAYCEEMVRQIGRCHSPWENGRAFKNSASRYVVASVLAVLKSLPKSK